MISMEFVRTDGKNKDFMENCRLLDMDLDRRGGKRIKRDKYSEYNKLDDIKEAIIIYEDGKLAGGGAIRKYYADRYPGGGYYEGAERGKHAVWEVSAENTVELKRIFVHPDYQGRGIGTELVSFLMEWARELGYRRMILETGELLAESCAVYQKLGFEVIPNYGPYADMPESLCMAREL